MILPDVNILLYAYDVNSKFHSEARAWLEEVLMDEQVYFSWHTITGFLRIITSPRIMVKPASLAQAVSIVNSWIVLANTHLVYLEKKNWPLFSRMLLEAQATGNLVMDTHLAAVAASCGAKLASTDRDFSRFSAIQWVDPLTTANDF